MNSVLRVFIVSSSLLIVTDKLDDPLKFYNSYIELGEQFFQRALPQKVPTPTLLLWNNAASG